MTQGIPPDRPATPPSRSPLTGALIASGRLLRDAWLVVGVVVAMLLVLEVAVRLVRRVSGADRVVEYTPAAYHGQRWYRDYVREFDATRPQRWLSYIYFGRLPGYHGALINIDSLGHRVTPQPATPAIPAARVFFFGGSTMWGSEQRDSFTIAAVAARRLQPLAGAGQRIEVTNYGESGYVFTQEVVDLMLELRHGARPDVVVFVDGINDGFATVQNGVAGVPQNEAKRQAEFAMGRAIDRTDFAKGTRQDLHALAVLGSAAVQQSALLEWLESYLPVHPFPMISADSGARSTVATYAGTARVVEALAREFGFTPVLVWQPTIQATGKALAPSEARIVHGLAADPFQRRLMEVQRAIPPLLDAAMAAAAPGDFVDETGVFDHDTAIAFVDRIGHNPEQAVPAIVDGFWPQLQHAVSHHLASAPPAPRTTN